MKQYYYRSDDAVHTLRLAIALPVDDTSVEPAGSTAASRRSTFTYGSADAAPSKQLWGLHEDKLLLKADDTKSDAVAMYLACHCIDPIMFPKVKVDAVMVRERTQELRSDVFLRKVVAALPEDTVLMAKVAESVSSFDLGSAVAPKRNLFAKAVQRVVKRFQFNRPDQVFRKEDTVLHIRVRRSEPHELMCCSEDIIKYSPFLAVQHSHAPYVDGNSSMRRITLDENAPMWAEIPNMHDVFAKDNVKRFINFLDTPNMLEQLIASNDKAVEATRLQEGEWNAFVNKSEALKEEKVQELDTHGERELLSLRKKYHDALENDITILREIYAGHVAREEANLTKKLDEQKNTIQEFFHRQHAAILEVKNILEDDNVVRKKDDLASICEATAETYGMPHLPRLLMLSDVLRCTELRTNCMKLISANFAGVMHNPQWNTQLIHANTMLELLSFVGDEKIVELYHESNAKMSSYVGIPADFIAKEYHSRWDAKMEELRKMDAIDLASLTRRVHLWLKRKGHDGRAVVEVDEDGKPVSMELGMTLLEAATKALGKLHLTAPLFQEGSVMLLSSLARSNAANNVAASADLQNGVSEEERYSYWKEAIFAALKEKQVSIFGEGSCVHLRIVPGLEATTSLTPSRRCVDVTEAFRYGSAEGQGCVRIGGSSLKIYFEARVLYIECGKRFPANVYVGLNPVAKCLNSTQVVSMTAALTALTALPETQKVSPAERLVRRLALHPKGSHIQECINAGTKAIFPSNARDRVVGVVPVDISSSESKLPLFGVAWTNDGIVYINGVPVDSRTPYDVGDILGFSINLLNGELKLSKNGDWLNGMDKCLLTSGVAYVPSVSLYSSMIPTVARSAIPAFSLNAPGFQVPTNVVGGEIQTCGKVRVEVEVEGRMHHMPHDHVPFVKAAAPAINVKV